jgi:hypothetical protein
VCRCLLDRRDAARRAHDEGLREALPDRSSCEPSQVRGEGGTEVGVDDCRRGALVLPELGRDLVRGNDVGSWVAFTEVVGERALV